MGTSPHPKNSKLIPTLYTGRIAHLRFGDLLEQLLKEGVEAQVEDQIVLVGGQNVQEEDHNVQEEDHIDQEEDHIDQEEGRTVAVLLRM